ncbi:MAG: ACT domain-containing protein [Burkholderiales bacterium]|nr:ACT domain-containing protein [Burkholderiales bacterium]
MKFLLRPESFCIHRLAPDARLDLDAFAGAAWYSITRTEDELSVVAPEVIDPGPGERKPGWSCLQVAGTLDLALVGVLAGIARVLAEAKVSLFVVSTYHTDCILVRQGDLERAVTALRAAGHTVTAA